MLKIVAPALSRPLLGTALVALALAPPAVEAQDRGEPEVLREMRELQREFEEYRERRTPVQSRRENGVCDERIGRICIWFGGDEEERFPAELREVRQARTELIRALSDGLERLPHRWILGQLVHYLVENDAMDEANRVATECGIAEAWWCSALRGYVLHVWTRYLDSEAAFREALAAMPREERDRWTTFLYVVPRGEAEELDELPPDERTALWGMYWRLSDPLFLMEGNDRLTDHLARWVEARNRDGAADPMGLEWREDLEESLIRYGRNIGYSRTHDPGAMAFGQLRDTRRMVGHHHPKSRGYIFPHEYLESPSDVPPESWITAPREARTWYAPPYAPEMRGLETQVGRFRRDDRMLVVGAYRPTVPDDEDRERMVAAWAGGEPGVEPPHTALFLVPEDGGPPVFVRGRDPEGVLTIEAPPGRWVSSLEVVDLQERRAWRARQGIVQLPLIPGLVGVSDMMLLREGAPLPETLDEALPHLRPGIRLRRGERFGVVWEVYGLRIEEPVRVTLGFSQGRPGFLERVGDFLGIIEPEEEIEVTFEDVGPDRLQAVFRSIELQLPNLDPGAYTLHLRLDLPGREPVVTSRPILVEE